MEAASLSPTPPSPDRILAIGLAVIAILGVAELLGVAVHSVRRSRPKQAAAAPAKAPAAAVPAPQNTAAPAEQSKSAPAAVQSTPSSEVLSVAERLLRDATLLREQGDTTNALARLQEAAQSDSKNANVLAQMAMIYESIQLYERSNETWRKIIDIGPSAGAPYELADMKLKQGPAAIAAPPVAATSPGPAAAAPPPETNAVRSDADGIPDGSTFGIAELTTTDSPDPDAETNMKLKISVKARPNTPVDHTKVKIQVFFYDTLDNQEAVLTDADVSYEWLTPHHDWKDTNPEILAVTYMRPKNKPMSAEGALSAAAAAITPGGKKKSSKKEPAAELPGESGHRKYLGYIVRIYYLDQLQAVRAEPTKLLNLFPPPFTAPSQ